MRTILAFVLAFVLLVPSVSHAATAADYQKQIDVLLAQLHALQASTPAPASEHGSMTITKVTDKAVSFRYSGMTRGWTFSILSAQTGGQQEVLTSSNRIRKTDGFKTMRMSRPAADGYYYVSATDARTQVRSPLFYYSSGRTGVTTVLTASAETVRAGSSTTLTWHAKGADSCRLSAQVVGMDTDTSEPVAVSGTKRVTPTVSTDYNLLCENKASGAGVYDSVLITVK